MASMACPRYRHTWLQQVKSGGYTVSRSEPQPTAMLETAQKPKVLPEWMWPALAIAMGLTGALSAVLTPSPGQAPLPEVAARVAPALSPAPPGLRSVPVPQPAPDVVPATPSLAEPSPAVPPPEIVAAAPVEVPIEVPTPEITARFLAPPAPRVERERVKSPRRPAKPEPSPKPAKVVPPASQPPEAKQPPAQPAVRAADPVAPPTSPSVASRPFKLLAVSGETVWATANDKTTVTAQVGEDLPAGMGKVVAVFRNGARFERNGKKFDLTVE